MNIRRIEQTEHALMLGLAQLLIDSVHSGASVGFLAPLDHEEASRYWLDVLAGLGPAQALWIAEQNGQIIGSVQLALCQRANGQHRAEVQKLFVLSQQRGRGIASQLMAALEHFARLQQRSLLVLDTEAGAPAEHVYRHLGWQKAGEIPGYAQSPNGDKHPTAYYFKHLDDPAHP